MQRITMTSDCAHRRGDQITDMGFWLCADCYAKLEARPARYGMVPMLKGTNGSLLKRQEVIWMAEIAIFDGVTFGSFVRTVAKRFMQKTRPAMDQQDAYDMAVSVIKELGDKFGDEAYDWSHEGARDLADEEMTYWDPAEGENA
jgi:hypothetical protein